MTVTLNLAASHPNITVDGRKYYHGRTYTVSKALAAVFADQQYRGWLHEDEIGGKSMNEILRPPRKTECRLARRGFDSNLIFN